MHTRREGKRFRDDAKKTAVFEAVPPRKHENKLTRRIILKRYMKKYIYSCIHNWPGFHQ